MNDSNNKNFENFDFLIDDGVHNNLLRHVKFLNLKVTATALFYIIIGILFDVVDKEMFFLFLMYLLGSNLSLILINMDNIVAEFINAIAEFSYLSIYIILFDMLLRSGLYELYKNVLVDFNLGRILLSLFFIYLSFSMVKNIDSHDSIKNYLKKINQK